MLRKDMDNLGYIYQKEELSSHQISRIEDMVSAQEKKVADAKYLLDVLHKEMISVYQSNVCYITLNPFSSKAGDWLRALKTGMINGEKVDKRKRYDEQKCFEHLQNTISRYIGHEVKITGHSFNGYDNWADSFEFECEGHKWLLQIPTIKNATYDTYKQSYGLCFKLALYNIYEGHVRGFVGSTYIEEDLAAMFDKYMKEVFGESKGKEVE